MSPSSVAERRAALPLTPQDGVRDVDLPRLRGLLRFGAGERLPAAALVLLVLLAHAVVLPARYGFLDDYALLYAAKTDPAGMTDHILGGGRPVFAATYLFLFGQVDEIAGLRYVRGLALLLTCLVALVLYRLLRSVATSPWTAAATAALLCVLPSTQVSIAWATMFIVPISMLFALSASAALQREVLTSGAVRPRALVLPALLMSLAVTSYQPGAMAFWLGLAIVVLGRAAVRDDLRLLRRLAVANLAVFTVGMTVGFVVLKVGIARLGVSGARAGTVTDVPGKLEWFLTEAMPRPFDPWSLTPRLEVVAGVAVLLLLGLVLLDARSPGRRALTVGLAACLVVLSYVPNLLVQENWASTRTMVALMPMVALLVTFAARAVLRTVLGLVRAGASQVVEPVLLGLVALAFAGHAAQLLQTYFVVPQEAELAAAEAAVQRQAASDEIVVVRSDWFDSIAPSEHYDEYGIPSSCQPGAALGLTQLLLEEETGQFEDGLRLVERTELPTGPQTAPVIDYADVLRGAESAAPTAG